MAGSAAVARAGALDTAERGHEHKGLDDEPQMRAHATA